MAQNKVGQRRHFEIGRAVNLDLDSVCWSASSLQSGFEALVDSSRLRASTTDDAQIQPRLESTEELSDWLRELGASMGVELTPITVRLRDVESLIKKSGPAIVAFESMNRFLLIVGSKGSRVSILVPDLRVACLDRNELTEAVFFALANDAGDTVESVLDAAGLSAARRDKARKSLAIELQSSAPVFAGWVVDVPTSATGLTQARFNRIPRRIALTLVSYIGYYLLVVASWWLLGVRALDGRLDAGLLVGWSLLLFSMVPMQVYGTWIRGQLAISVGAVLKRIMHSGALRLDLNETKREGAGILLGRVIESEIVESLAVNGGLVSILAVLQLAIAISILYLGAAGRVLVSILFFTIFGAVVLAYVHYRKQKNWVEQRLTITQDLVEKMVGYRTRLMQLSENRWYTDDDNLLKNYYAKSCLLDNSTIALALIPRAWLFLAFAGMAPNLLFESAPIASIGIAIGGSLLAFQALEAFVTGLANNVSALLAFKKIAPIYRAAQAQDVIGSFASRIQSAGKRKPTSPVIDIRNATYSYPGRSCDALKDINFRVYSGDRLVIEGRSGSGKSTLVALMAGLYQPNDGVILMNGMDLPSLGPRNWRKRVVLVPQFHDNYIVAESLAFNLFIGSDWPPSPEQFEQAWSICGELGLRGLIERMPAGLMQLVGETGWRLSHGERSRIYVARALLQKPQLLMIDESFGALDSENFDRVMKCVVERAETLVIISHP